MTKFVILVLIVLICDRGLSRPTVDELAKRVDGAYRNLFHNIQIRKSSDDDHYGIDGSKYDPGSNKKVEGAPDSNPFDENISKYGGNKSENADIFNILQNREKEGSDEINHVTIANSSLKIEDADDKIQIYRKDIIENTKVVFRLGENGLDNVNNKNKNEVLKDAIDSHVFRNFTSQRTQKRVDKYNDQAINNDKNKHIGDNLLENKLHDDNYFHHSKKKDIDNHQTSHSIIQNNIFDNAIDTLSRLEEGNTKYMGVNDLKKIEDFQKVDDDKNYKELDIEDIENRLRSKRNTRTIIFKKFQNNEENQIVNDFDRLSQNLGENMNEKSKLYKRSVITPTDERYHYISATINPIDTFDNTHYYAHPHHKLSDDELWRNRSVANIMELLEKYQRNHIGRHHSDHHLLNRNEQIHSTPFPHLFYNYPTPIPHLNYHYTQSITQPFTGIPHQSYNYQYPSNPPFENYHYAKTPSLSRSIQTLYKPAEIQTTPIPYLNYDYEKSENIQQNPILNYNFAQTPSLSREQHTNTLNKRSTSELARKHSTKMPHLNNAKSQTPHEIEHTTASPVNEEILKIIEKYFEITSKLQNTTPMKRFSEKVDNNEIKSDLSNEYVNYPISKEQEIESSTRPNNRKNVQKQTQMENNKIHIRNQRKELNKDIVKLTQRTTTKSPKLHPTQELTNQKTIERPSKQRDLFHSHKNIQKSKNYPHQGQKSSSPNIKGTASRDPVQTHDSDFKNQPGMDNHSEDTIEFSYRIGEGNSSEVPHSKIQKLPVDVTKNTYNNRLSGTLVVSENGNNEKPDVILTDTANNNRVMQTNYQRVYSPKSMPSDFSPRPFTPRSRRILHQRTFSDDPGTSNHRAINFGRKNTLYIQEGYKSANGKTNTLETIEELPENGEFLPYGIQVKFSKFDPNLQSSGLNNKKANENIDQTKGINIQNFVHTQPQNMSEGISIQNQQLSLSLNQSQGSNIQNQNINLQRQALFQNQQASNINNNSQNNVTEQKKPTENGNVQVIQQNTLDQAGENKNINHTSDLKISPVSDNNKDIIPQKISSSSVKGNKTEAITSIFNNNLTTIHENMRSGNHSTSSNQNGSNNILLTSGENTNIRRNTTSTNSNKNLEQGIVSEQIQANRQEQVGVRSKQKNDNFVNKLPESHKPDIIVTRNGENHGIDKKKVNISQERRRQDNKLQTGNNIVQRHFSRQNNIVNSFTAINHPNDENHMYVSPNPIHNFYSYQPIPEPKHKPQNLNNYAIPTTQKNFANIQNVKRTQPQNNHDIVRKQNDEMLHQMANEIGRQAELLQKSNNLQLQNMPQIIQQQLLNQMKQESLSNKHQLSLQQQNSNVHEITDKMVKQMTNSVIKTVQPEMIELSDTIPNIPKQLFNLQTQVPNTKYRYQFTERNFAGKPIDQNSKIHKFADDVAKSFIQESNLERTIQNLHSITEASIPKLINNLANYKLPTGIYKPITEASNIHPKPNFGNYQYKSEIYYPVTDASNQNFDNNKFPKEIFNTVTEIQSKQYVTTSKPPSYKFTGDTIIKPLKPKSNLINYITSTEASIRNLDNRKHTVPNYQPKLHDYTTTVASTDEDNHQEKGLDFRFPLHFNEDFETEFLLATMVTPLANTTRASFSNPLDYYQFSKPYQLHPTVNHWYPPNYNPSQGTYPDYKYYDQRLQVKPTVSMSIPKSNKIKMDQMNMLGDDRGRKIKDIETSIEIPSIETKDVNGNLNEDEKSRTMTSHIKSSTQVSSNKYKNKGSEKEKNKNEYRNIKSAPENNIQFSETKTYDEAEQHRNSDLQSPSNNSPSENVYITQFTTPKQFNSDKSTPTIFSNAPQATTPTPETDPALAFFVTTPSYYPEWKRLYGTLDYPNVATKSSVELNPQIIYHGTPVPDNELSYTIHPNITSILEQLEMKPKSDIDETPDTDYDKSLILKALHKLVNKGVSANSNEQIHVTPIRNTHKQYVTHGSYYPNSLQGMHQVSPDLHKHSSVTCSCAEKTKYSQIIANNGFMIQTPMQGIHPVTPGMMKQQHFGPPNPNFIQPNFGPQNEEILQHPAELIHNFGHNHGEIFQHHPDFFHHPLDVLQQSIGPNQEEVFHHSSDLMQQNIDPNHLGIFNHPLNLKQQQIPLSVRPQEPFLHQRKYDWAGDSHNQIRFPVKSESKKKCGESVGNRNLKNPSEYFDKSITQTPQNQKEMGKHVQTKPLKQENTIKPEKKENSPLDISLPLYPPHSRDTFKNEKYDSLINSGLVLPINVLNLSPTTATHRETLPNAPTNRNLSTKVTRPLLNHQGIKNVINKNQVQNNIKQVQQTPKKQLDSDPLINAGIMIPINILNSASVNAPNSSHHDNTDKAHYPEMLNNQKQKNNVENINQVQKPPTSFNEKLPSNQQQHRNSKFFREVKGQKNIPNKDEKINQFQRPWYPNGLSQFQNYQQPVAIPPPPPGPPPLPPPPPVHFLDQPSSDSDPLINLGLEIPINLLNSDQAKPSSSNQNFLGRPSSNTGAFINLGLKVPVNIGQTNAHQDRTNSRNPTTEINRFTTDIDITLPLNDYHQHTNTKHSDKEYAINKYNNRLQKIEIDKDQERGHSGDSKKQHQEISQTKQPNSGTIIPVQNNGFPRLHDYQVITTPSHLSSQSSSDSNALAHLGIELPINALNFESNKHLTQIDVTDPPKSTTEVKQFPTDIDIKHPENIFPEQINSRDYDYDNHQDQQYIGIKNVKNDQGEKWKKQVPTPVYSQFESQNIYQKPSPNSEALINIPVEIPINLLNLNPANPSKTFQNKIPRDDTYTPKSLTEMKWNPTDIDITPENYYNEKNYGREVNIKQDRVQQKTYRSEDQILSNFPQQENRFLQFQGYNQPIATPSYQQHYTTSRSESTPIDVTLPAKPTPEMRHFKSYIDVTLSPQEQLKKYNNRVQLSQTFHHQFANEPGQIFKEQKNFRYEPPKYDQRLIHQINVDQQREGFGGDFNNQPHDDKQFVIRKKTITIPEYLKSTMYPSDPDESELIIKKQVLDNEYQDQKPYTKKHHQFLGYNQPIATPVPIQSATQSLGDALVNTGLEIPINLLSSKGSKISYSHHQHQNVDITEVPHKISNIGKNRIKELSSIDENENKIRWFESKHPNDSTRFARTTEDINSKDTNKGLKSHSTIKYETIHQDQLKLRIFPEDKYPDHIDKYDQITRRTPHHDHTFYNRQLAESDYNTNEKTLQYQQVDITEYPIDYLYKYSSYQYPIATFNINNHSNNQHNYGIHHALSNYGNSKDLYQLKSHNYEYGRSNSPYHYIDITEPTFSINGPTNKHSEHVYGKASGENEYNTERQRHVHIRSTYNQETPEDHYKSISVTRLRQSLEGSISALSSLDDKINNGHIIGDVNMQIDITENPNGKTDYTRGYDIGGYFSQNEFNVTETHENFKQLTWMPQQNTNSATIPYPVTLTWRIPQSFLHTHHLQLNPQIVGGVENSNTYQEEYPIDVTQDYSHVLGHQENENFHSQEASIINGKESQNPQDNSQPKHVNHFGINNSNNQNLNDKLDQPQYNTEKLQEIGDYSKNNDSDIFSQQLSRENNIPEKKNTQTLDNASDKKLVTWNIPKPQNLPSFLKYTNNDKKITWKIPEIVTLPNTFAQTSNSATDTITPPNKKINIKQILQNLSRFSSILNTESLNFTPRISEIAGVTENPKLRNTQGRIDWNMSNILTETTIPRTATERWNPLAWYTQTSKPKEAPTEKKKNNIWNLFDTFITTAVTTEKPKSFIGELFNYFTTPPTINGNSLTYPSNINFLRNENQIKTTLSNGSINGTKIKWQLPYNFQEPKRLVVDQNVQEPYGITSSLPQTNVGNTETSEIINLNLPHETKPSQNVGILRNPYQSNQYIESTSRPELITWRMPQDFTSDSTKFFRKQNDMTEFGKIGHLQIGFQNTAKPDMITWSLPQEFTQRPDNTKPRNMGHYQKVYKIPTSLRPEQYYPQQYQYMDSTKKPFGHNIAFQQPLKNNVLNLQRETTNRPQRPPEYPRNNLQYNNFGNIKTEQLQGYISNPDGVLHQGHISPQNQGYVPFRKDSHDMINGPANIPPVYKNPAAYSPHQYHHIASTPNPLRQNTVTRTNNELNSPYRISQNPQNMGYRPPMSHFGNEMASRLPQFYQHPHALQTVRINRYTQEPIYPHMLQDQQLDHLMHPIHQIHHPYHEFRSMTVEQPESAIRRTPGSLKELEYPNVTPSIKPQTKGTTEMYKIRSETLPPNNKLTEELFFKPFGSGFEFFVAPATSHKPIARKTRDELHERVPNYHVPLMKSLSKLTDDEEKEEEPLQDLLNRLMRNDITAVHSLSTRSVRTAESQIPQREYPMQFSSPNPFLPSVNKQLHKVSISKPIRFDQSVPPHPGLDTMELLSPFFYLVSIAKQKNGTHNQILADVDDRKMVMISNGKQQVPKHIMYTHASKFEDVTMRIHQQQQHPSYVENKTISNKQSTGYNQKQQLSNVDLRRIANKATAMHSQQQRLRSSIEDRTPNQSSITHNQQQIFPSDVTVSRTPSKSSLTHQNHIRVEDMRKQEDKKGSNYFLHNQQQSFPSTIKDRWIPKHEFDMHNHQQHISSNVEEKLKSTQSISIINEKPRNEDAKIPNKQSATYTHQQQELVPNVKIDKKLSNLNHLNLDDEQQSRNSIFPIYATERYTQLQQKTKNLENPSVVQDRKIPDEQIRPNVVISKGEISIKSQIKENGQDSAIQKQNSDDNNGELNFKSRISSKSSKMSESDNYHFRSPKSKITSSKISTDHKINQDKFRSINGTHLENKKFHESGDSDSLETSIEDPLKHLLVQYAKYLRHHKKDPRRKHSSEEDFYLDSDSLEEYRHRLKNRKWKSKFNTEYRAASSAEEDEISKIIKSAERKIRMNYYSRGHTIPDEDYTGRHFNLRKNYYQNFRNPSKLYEDMIPDNTEYVNGDGFGQGKYNKHLLNFDVSDKMIPRSDRTMMQNIKQKPEEFRTLAKLTTENHEKSRPDEIRFVSVKPEDGKSNSISVHQNESPRIEKMNSLTSGIIKESFPVIGKLNSDKSARVQDFQGIGRINSINSVKEKVENFKRMARLNSGKPKEFLGFATPTPVNIIRPTNPSNSVKQQAIQAIRLTDSVTSIPDELPRFIIKTPGVFQGTEEKKNRLIFETPGLKEFRMIPKMENYDPEPTISTNRLDVNSELQRMESIKNLRAMLEKNDKVIKTNNLKTNPNEMRIVVKETSTIRGELKEITRTTQGIIETATSENIDKFRNTDPIQKTTEPYVVHYSTTDNIRRKLIAEVQSKASPIEILKTSTVETSNFSGKTMNVTPLSFAKKIMNSHEVITQLIPKEKFSSENPKSSPELIKIRSNKTTILSQKESSEELDYSSSMEKTKPKVSETSFTKIPVSSDSKYEYSSSYSSDEVVQNQSYKSNIHKNIKNKSGKSYEIIPNTSREKLHETNKSKSIFNTRTNEETATQLAITGKEPTKNEKEIKPYKMISKHAKMLDNKESNEEIQSQKIRSKIKFSKAKIRDEGKFEEETKLDKQKLATGPVVIESEENIRPHKHKSKSKQKEESVESFEEIENHKHRSKLKSKPNEVNSTEEKVENKEVVKSHRYRAKNKSKPKEGSAIKIVTGGEMENNKEIRSRKHKTKFRSEPKEETVPNVERGPESSEEIRPHSYRSKSKSRGEIESEEVIKSHKTRKLKPKHSSEDQESIKPHRSRSKFKSPKSIEEVENESANAVGGPISLRNKEEIKHKRRSKTKTKHKEESSHEYALGGGDIHSSAEHSKEKRHRSHSKSKSNKHTASSEVHRRPNIYINEELSENDEDIVPEVGGVIRIHHNHKKHRKPEIGLMKIQHAEHHHEIKRHKDHKHKLRERELTPNDERYVNYDSDHGKRNIHKGIESSEHLRRSKTGRHKSDRFSERRQKGQHRKERYNRNR